MPPLDLLLSFIVTATLIELTPGPNMAYLAILSVEHGRRAGFAAVVGIALGLFIAGAVAALGLAALIDALPAAYEVLRWAGTAYLLWLAWEGWKGGEGSPADVRRSVQTRVHFRRGLITNLLNPKAYLFYIAMLPRFVAPELPPMAQTFTLSVAYVAVATVIHASIAALAGSAQPFVSQSGYAKLIQRLLSLLLAGVAIWLAFVTRR